MSEQQKEPTPASQPTPEEEKKAVPPPAPKPPTPAQVSQAQRPSAVTPPRPAVTPTAPPPRVPLAPPKSAARRTFVKVVVTLGALLSLSPYVPWGEFLSSSVSAGKGAVKQKVTIDNNPAIYGAAAGKAVNVSDVASFPPNSHWVVTYPSSGDSSIDAQNTDTFVKYELIRLPSELGGAQKAAAAFVAFSKVCVHLWCSPNYVPEQCTNPSENGYAAPPNCTKHEQYECPCHGSIYEIPSGKAVSGPAALQPAPTNAIPLLTLSTDSDGFLYIEPPVWDVNHNGVLGYGRYVQ